jgi:hypothetical protein
VPKLKTPRRGTSQKRTAKSAVPARKTKLTARKKSKRKVAPRSAPHGTKPIDQASSDEEAAFTEALIQSGQAAPLDSEGKLPAGATHKIVEDPAGQLKVVRRRFSIS